ncbi:MAG: hypothetical protein J5504_00760 [Butyrivibrio sp.]|nr:hypothetical protein [Butyrivibrio sp.]
MMISAEGYKSMHENDSIDELIAARKQLVGELEQLEKIVRDTDRTDESWNEGPGPDVRYHMTLTYLVQICELLWTRVSKEVSWDE